MQTTTYINTFLTSYTFSARTEFFGNNSNSKNDTTRSSVFNLLDVLSESVIKHTVCHKQGGLSYIPGTFGHCTSQWFIPAVAPTKQKTFTSDLTAAILDAMLDAMLALLAHCSRYYELSM